MFILDTDSFTHLLRGSPKMISRRSQVDEDVVLCSITRIEVLQGRFASILRTCNLLTSPFPVFGTVALLRQKRTSWNYRATRMKQGS